jgi:hypothetical protein
MTNASHYAGNAPAPNSKTLDFSSHLEFSAGTGRQLCSERGETDDTCHTTDGLNLRDGAGSRGDEWEG